MEAEGYICAMQNQDSPRPGRSSKSLRDQWRNTNQRHNCLLRPHPNKLCRSRRAQVKTTAIL